MVGVDAGQICNLSQITQFAELTDYKLNIVYETQLWLKGFELILISELHNSQWRLFHILVFVIYY